MKTTDPRDLAPSRSQSVRHLVLSILLWATYLLYWRVVLARGVEREAALALGLLGLFVLLQLAFTQAWIVHNRRLSKRYDGRRAARPVDRVHPVADFVGRRLRVSPPGTDLTAVPVIVIRVDEHEKCLEAGLELEVRRGKA